MSNVSQICATIGRGRLAVLLGVSPAAVSNASSEGVFPAAWYAVIRRECETLGIECDLSLFRFRASQGGDAA